jgi:hypothetical protein
MDRSWQAVVGYGIPVAYIVALVAAYGALTPWVRLVAATAGLLFSIKVGASVVLSARSVSYDITLVESVIFWTVWPAVRIDCFADSDADRPPEGDTFVQGYLLFLVGVLLALATPLLLPTIGRPAAGWLFILAVLCIVHLGLAAMAPVVFRIAGLSVPAMFDDPLRSRSISDFWSKRWNLPFVNMNRLFITRPFADRIGFTWAAFLAFLVSGVLHDLAISYAAGGGWGLPFAYFVVQAGLYETERRFLDGIESANRVLRSLWVWGGLLLPLPLLFHAPFRTTFVLPVVDGLRALLLSYPIETYLDWGLWLAAAGHLLVLGASVQVPDQLNWHEDLASLHSLNRKLLWTYAAFIVLIIVSFGVLTAVFHDAFLAGNPVALGLATLIAVFWIARILVDVFYFSHDDWPEGVEFVIGHAMLTSLFVFLVVVYVSTIMYHRVGG